MKIALFADAPHLDARLEQKPGAARYLLVVDTETMAFEAVPGPARSGGPGAGVELLSMAAGMGAQAILVGYVAPPIAAALEKKGIRVITSVSGRVRDHIERFREGMPTPEEDGVHTGDENVADPSPSPWKEALQKTSRQVLGMLPILTGVILLLGLFHAFVPESGLTAFFSGQRALDILRGAGAGSVLAGNPVNSYVLGRGLLDMGVSLSAVTAFMLSWVFVGLVQLPAEMATLGARFAVTRNVAAFVSTLAAAPLIVWLAGGW